MLDILTIPALAVGAFFAVSYFISPDTIVIQHISVPPSMEDRGYSGAVATTMLSDSVARISDEAGTNRGAYVAEETAQAKSVEALSDWFGLAQPIRATQVALGFLPYSFSGEFVEDADELVLRIRGQSSEYWHFVIEKRGSKDDVEGLVNAAAIELLTELDPYLIAVYHFRYDIPTGDFTKTKSAIDHALVNAPRKNLPWVYALWAHVLFFEGDLEGSIMKNRQALALEPTFPRPMMRWGEALQSMGMHEEAIGRFKKTLEIDPHYPEAIVLWANSLLAQNKIKEAGLKFHEAYEMSPDFPRIVHAYGMYHVKYGNKIKAADILRRAVELDEGRNPKFVRDLRAVQRMIEPGLEGFESDKDGTASAPAAAPATSAPAAAAATGSS
ncbi:tetratricopeptide repeat protein [Thalassobaculum sp. OXR-137]|uniref:tetratricopeptide repeat protein n=1 Tax=Thalassobaculum sp. OXR-137 TaxID=3100173 RepID=UPI002AC9709E|nr:tetratricopeptide repeat protein [Thalassobaculum sp. OXR-137]WPZ34614.1 tetratricopeptide repeat protein [Thalassobaculum sp. OXR-137]